LIATHQLNERFCFFFQKEALPFGLPVPVPVPVPVPAAPTPRARVGGDDYPSRASRTAVCPRLGRRLGITSRQSS
jgi:hypothetical protein